MSSNLEAAAAALRKLQPKKKFRVSFTERTYSYVDVEAVDNDEAIELAEEERSNGNNHQTDWDSDVDSVEELTN